MCQNLKVWFGRSNSDTFSSISWGPMHIFQNRFLRGNLGGRGNLTGTSGNIGAEKWDMRGVKFCTKKKGYCSLASHLHCQINKGKKHISQVLGISPGLKMQFPQYWTDKVSFLSSVNKVSSGLTCQFLHGCPVFFSRLASYS